MALKFTRTKPKNLLLSILYRLHKLPWATKEKKMRLYLDLEWIFCRLAHEQSFKLFSSVDHPFHHLACEFLLKLLKEDHKVVDLGCNIGERCYVLAGKAKEVIGVDLNESVIKKAKKTYQKDNLTFVCSGAKEYVEKTKETFDVLILSNFLEHLEDPMQLLQQCKPFFKYIYIELPQFDAFLLNIYRKEFNSSLAYGDLDHIWEFDKKDMIKMIKDSDLNIITSEYRFGIQKYWCSV